MTSQAPPLSELYEKALFCAAAQGLMSAQEQERLEKSLAAVLSELRRFRGGKVQTSKFETAALLREMANVGPASGAAPTRKTTIAAAPGKLPGTRTVPPTLRKTAADGQAAAASAPEDAAGVGPKTESAQQGPRHQLQSPFERRQRQDAPARQALRPPGEKPAPPKAPPLAEYYEKALSRASADGLMPAQEQERLQKSLAAVLAELLRHRGLQQRTVRLNTASQLQEIRAPSAAPAKVQGDRAEPKEVPAAHAPARRAEEPGTGKRAVPPVSGQPPAAMTARSTPGPTPGGVPFLQQPGQGQQNYIQLMQNPAKPARRKGLGLAHPDISIPPKKPSLRPLEERENPR